MNAILNRIASGQHQYVAGGLSLARSAQDFKTVEYRQPDTALKTNVFDLVVLDAISCYFAAC